MVRIPRSWQQHMHMPASSYSAPGSGWSRRITPVSAALYVNPVTVDLGNDGMAPLAVFTAGGTAQAVIGPSGGGDSWSLDQCYVSTSVGQLDAAQCIVYVGPLPIAQYAVTSSLAGGGSQFGLGGLGFTFGWFVWALWTGGTPGATGQLRVTGSKTVLTN